MATIGDVLEAAVKNWRDPYQREAAERESTTKSFMRYWDRDHPAADKNLRREVKAAFTFGHLSACQDIANRNARR
jgi:hypothetical protein